MKFEVFETPQALYNVVKSFLHKQEVTNSLMIGILRRVNKDDYSDDFFCLGRDNDEVKIVMIILGLHIIVATEDQATLRPAAEFITSQNLDYPGVIGPRPFVDLLVEDLKKSSGVDIELGMSQRIYRLDKVEDIKKAEGSMRFAREEDLEMLVDWTLDSGMAMSDDRKLEADKRMAAIQNQVMFLWEVDGKPVAMTALSRSVGDGITISLVYTPESERKKGYASNLVAQVSKHALKTYKYCTLYTDLSNPTSNSIYMKIGYKPIVDSAMYLVQGRSS